MKPPRPFEPTRLLVDLNYAAKIWFLLFLVATVSLVCSLIIQLSPPTRVETRYIVVDSRGATTMGYNVRLQDATNVHFRAAADATFALLNRRPSGFDQPELLAELFQPAALEKARAWSDREKAERTSKSIHQKAEASHYEYGQLSDGRALVTIKGQLILVGTIGSQHLVESTRFQLELQLALNPDLTSNARHPLLVSNFRYEQSPR
ncbi:MAG: hypothetical protein JNN07_22850 [Verrucomicrobiales bacterium]|nr:hypothetical protein [Verrucomicrobiales bacterium]